MLRKLSNKKRKKEVGKALEAERARIQASIDACNAKRDENRKKRKELAEEQEELRLRQLANLRKKMVIMFAMVGNETIILAIVDPTLMNDNSVRMKHHITYGSPDYEKIYMRASYSPRGKRSERPYYSYTVSTADGSNFNIIDKDGTTRLSFETQIHYESLAGKSVSGVQFDQFWYNPFKGQFDDETGKFHAELDRLIQADAEYVSGNPELLGKGYIPYFRFGC